MCSPLAILKAEDETQSRLISLSSWDAVQGCCRQQQFWKCSQPHSAREQELLTLCLLWICRPFKVLQPIPWQSPCVQLGSSLGTGASNCRVQCCCLFQSFLSLGHSAYSVTGEQTAVSALENHGRQREGGALWHM